MTTSVVQYTADDLATDAPESVPFADQEVSSLWTEVDVDSNRIVAGGFLGGVAISNDGGATWSLRTVPEVSPIVKIILSRFISGQIHALTAANYWVSDNNGSGWRLVRAAASGQTFNDLALSHTRNVIASTITAGGSPLELAEASTPAFTFPVLTPAVSIMLACAADIRRDIFYCYDAAGRTFRTSTDGGVAMTQGQDLPSTSQCQLRGMYRHGSIPALLYFANGTNGVWKTVDGFATSAGLYQLRKAGVDGADAASDWKMVGAGELVVAATRPTPAPSGTAAGFFASRGTGELLVSTDGISWSISDDIWGDGETAVAFAASATKIWVSLLSGGFKSSIDGGVTWVDETPGGGYSYSQGIVNSATGILVAAFTTDYSTFSLQVSDDDGATWTELTNFSGAPWSLNVPGALIETGDPTKPRLIWSQSTGSTTLNTMLVDGTGSSTITSAAGAGTQLIPACEPGSTTAMLISYSAQTVYKINADLTTTNITPATMTDRSIAGATSFDSTNIVLIRQFSGFDQDNWRGEVYRSTGTSQLASVQTNVRMYQDDGATFALRSIARRPSDGLWIMNGDESIEAAIYHNGVEGTCTWYSSDDGVTWTKTTQIGEFNFFSGQPELYAIGAFG